MQWVVVDERTPSESREKGSELQFINASQMQVSADALAKLSVVPDLVLGHPDAHKESQAAEESDNQSALYGRYIGQINARVTRAWLRPRTPIGASTFDCRAHIQQDVTGIVKEVTLESCNGDMRWQLSVVQAVQAASPLPAPPAPGVFHSIVVVPFHSGEYMEGSSSKDDFESPVTH